MCRRLVSLLLLIFLFAACRRAPVAPPPAITPTPRPAATATPAPLTAIPAPGVDLDAFPLNAPFVLVFSRPMDTSLAEPLRITPSRDGESRWSEDGTVLTFTPRETLQPGRPYTVALDEALRAADGTAFAGPMRWRLHTLIGHAPRVVRRQPDRGRLAERRPAISVTFDRPMDKESVRAALQVAPALAYTLSWQEETLQLDLQEPLQFGVTYQFTVTEQARDAAGAPLDRPYIWQHSLREPLQSASWPSRGNHLAPLRLRFNYAVDPQSFLDAVTLAPAVEGVFAWDAEQTGVTFRPENRFPAGATFTLAFSQPLRDVQGLELPAPEPIQFTTPPPILLTLPEGHSVRPDSPVELLFDRPVDQATAEAAFSIEPPLPGAFTWAETRLIFQPEGGLAEHTSYTVTIGEGVRAADGEALLREPTGWTFTTGRYGRVASFGLGPNAQVLDAAGRRAVHFAAYTNAATVQFELYPLTLAQFLERYASGFRGAAGWDSAEPPPISTAGMTPLTRWEMTLSGARMHETQVPPEAPPGLYILTLSAGRLNDQLILVLSHHTLAVKQAGEQLVAWVTDINGDAIPGAPVSVYARSGARLASGSADENGVFHTTLPPYRAGGPPSIEPLIVVAGAGGDLTVSGLAPEWREGGYWGWWQPASAANSYAAYLFTDRPIYKPGQSIYFKAIVRRDEDAMFSLPPAGTPLLVRLRDARDNVVETLALTSSALGSADGSFLLSDGAMLGVYHLELVVDGESHRQALKVEDYRKPDYEVLVSVGGERAVTGDTLTVTVEARTFFGEPVAGAEVNLASFRTLPNYGWEGLPGESSWYVEGDSGVARSGRTDASGRFTTTVAAPKVDEGGYRYGYGGANRTLQMGWALEASVADGSNQDVFGFAALTVYSAGEQVALDTRGYLHRPGQPFTVDATVATISGEPVAGRTLRLELRRWRPTSYAYDDVVQSETLVSDGSGRARLSFTVREPGAYRLVVGGEDGHGRAIGVESWIYAFSELAGGGWYGRQSELSIAADRASYAPGDTAHLLIESTFRGPALLTFERGTTRREQPVMLTAPVTAVEVTIEAGDVPNVYVTVNAWQPQETVLGESAYESIPDSRLRQASVNLSVPATAQQLVVTITPEQESYAPRAEAAFTIAVHDAAGRPVAGAEVTAALVDEAIFALSEELSGPIHDGFYAERGNLVRTFNSMALIRYLDMGGQGGGGGGLPPGGPRADFPDTAAWLPSLTTDAAGLVTITVTLPDSLTTWRMTARAATADTRVGEATASILTQQPIVVRPLLPRALTAGDSVQLSAMIYNTSAEPHELAVGLIELDRPILALAGPLTQTVTLPPGARVVIGWAAQALEAGTARLQLAALPSAADALLYGDAVIAALPVQPLAVADVETQVGQFTGVWATTLTMPPGALAASTVELQLSRSIAGTLLEGLEYLTGFPYGCVEQTMSKALPNAVVGRALARLGVSNPTLAADLPARIGASVQRLYGYQHDDGGWGWWYDDPTHDYQTAWVVYGLAMTAEAGYEVDGAVIARGAHWLEAHLAEMDPRTRAFALYSLALAREIIAAADEAALAAPRERWEPEPQVVDFTALSREALALSGAPGELDTFARAALALALYHLGEVEAAGLLVDDLAGQATVADGRAYWPDEAYDGAYYQKTMASTTRSTALALSAFSTIRPGHSLEPDIVRWLMAQRRQQGWGTTNETSFAVVALSDHLLATGFGETDATSDYTVRLNGEVVASGQLDRGEPASLQLDGALWAAGRNDLVIEQSGNRPLYYVVSRRALLPQTEIEAAGVVGVRRRYLDPATKRPLAQAAPGQLVLVELRVTLPDGGSYLIVEDHLPGGLEALNERLNTTSHRAQAYAEPATSWQTLGYNHKEIFGDRVSFFITELGAGQHTFTYLARASHAGAFTAMPAEVYGMYNLALWGRSASDAFLVD